MAQEGQEEEQYQYKDTVANAIRSTTISGSAGLLFSAVQNTLTKQNVGAMGVFTRTGGTVGMFAAMGGAYEFTKNASANLREKDDAWNNSVGGLFAGCVLGLRTRSAPAVLGYGAGLAVIVGAFHLGGGMFSSLRSDPNIDDVERKEYQRRNRRRPYEELVNELGEGRGIYAPGYPERRAQRLLDRYGIDVKNPAPAVGPPPQAS